LGKLDFININGADYPTPDGTCIRDYIHVEDLAEAHLLAIERCVPGDAVAYNVGTGKGTSVLEIIAAARAVTDRPITTVTAERRPGDPPALYADPSLIQRQLGWTPRYLEISDIIGTAWRWHRSHPSGFGA
jgi:UDP-glucose 4-epimerase